LQSFDAESNRSVSGALLRGHPAQFTPGAAPVSTGG
jgi:hypothetical protein